MAKRYVLFLSESELSEGEAEEFAAALEARRWKAKVILPKDCPRALIVKTTTEYAPLMRSGEEAFAPGGKRLKAVLTSGAVGNLKRRAAEATANGQVHE